MAQTTLRCVLGQVELDELLAQRDKINRQLQEIIDKHTEPWGVKVTAVEVKQVDLPGGDAPRHGEAGRGGAGAALQGHRGRGRVQASEKLGQAADVIGRSPGALQLRYLQTLVEIAAEKNSTILFPLPIELVRPFLEMAKPR